jgi:hypothetical protein
VSEELLQRIADLEARVAALEGNGPKTPRWTIPTIEIVHTLFVKAGSSFAEADRFFNYYMANGWMVGKNRMKSLPHAVAHWLGRAPLATSSPGPKKPSVWELKTQLEAIQSQMAELKDKHTEPGAFGGWLGGSGEGSPWSQYQNLKGRAENLKKKLTELLT